MIYFRCYANGSVVLCTYIIRSQIFLGFRNMFISCILFIYRYLYPFFLIISLFYSFVVVIVIMESLAFINKITLKADDSKMFWRNLLHPIKSVVVWSTRLIIDNVSKYALWNYKILMHINWFDVKNCSTICWRIVKILNLFFLFWNENII